jgi:hypothetical protein
MAISPTRIDERFWVAECPRSCSHFRVYFDSKLAAQVENQPHLGAVFAEMSWLRRLFPRARGLLGEAPPYVISRPRRSRTSKP